MDELCVIDFSQDLEYWMIDDLYLEVIWLVKHAVSQKVLTNKRDKIRQQNTTKRNMEKRPCEIVPQIHCRRLLDEKSEELRGNFPGCYLAMDHGLLGGRSHIQSSESR